MARYYCCYSIDFRQAPGTNLTRPAFSEHLKSTEVTIKGVPAWLIGIPLPIINLLYLLDAFQGICSRPEHRSKGLHMLYTVLIIVLILALIGALPRWGHSANWGYGPSGVLGAVLVILIVLVLMGQV